MRKKPNATVAKSVNKTAPTSKRAGPVPIAAKVALPSAASRPVVRARVTTPAATTAAPPPPLPVPVPLPLPLPALTTVDEADQAPVAAHWKLVRDRFKMPPHDFERIADLKARAVALHRPARKSELLRAGLLALSRLSDADFFAILGGIVGSPARRRKRRSEKG